jgi:mannitol-1-/sugar-/sorbitol-6-phosphatase
MPTFHCAAILFDLDGVLVDSTGSVSRLWRLWATEHQLDPEKVLSIAHGVRTIEVVRAAAPWLDAVKEVKKIEEREASDRDGVSTMAGASALVRSIPADRWAIVTSGTRMLASARLRSGNISPPAVLVSADEVINGKPDPEPYLMGARLLRHRPEDCLVVEDAPAGIQAAKAAGMKVIGITTTYPRGQLGAADAVIDSLTAIGIRISGARLEVTVTPN